MRSIDQWLGMYAESHRNRTNKIVHWICVPLIVWSVIALLYVIPAPLTGMWAWIALFLLIGPAWLIAHLYRRAGLRY